MINVSRIYTDRPYEYKSELQRTVYEILEKLDIPYRRVDTDPAVTMQDCENISEALGVRIIKTIFLSNRQKTVYHLFVTTDDKPFSSKNFGAAMGVSRVSFADEESLRSIIGVIPGAATVFGVLLDSASDVNVVFDREAIETEWYGCSDGTVTGYMRVRTVDILEKLLPYSGHEYTVIDI